MDLRVRPDLTIPEAELVWRFSTSGGPGGQHANRAATRVELVWNVEDSAVLGASMRARLIDRVGPVMRVVADDHRSQARNRELAERRLTARVAEALVERVPRRATRPGRAAIQRRLDAKRRRGRRKRERRSPGIDD